jgi:hypothetical protein
MKLALGITYMWDNKPRTLQEYIEYRNMIIERGTARSNKFHDFHQNYYWLRLIEIDNQYPEFKGLGIVRLKEQPKQSKSRYKAPKR